MKISCSWLNELLPNQLSPEEIAEKLTFAGLEVEGIENFDSVPGGLKGLVVGEVLSCERHPNADKLSLTTVNVGTGEALKIVCGASNVAAGQKVIVATVGTQLYPKGAEPFEIKKSKIRGEVSEGMICAEDEIGLGNSHDGIMVLPPETKVGISAAEYFNLKSDTILEIGLTPNRADAASHYGVARDLFALLVLEGRAADANAQLPSVPESFTASKGPEIEVVVEDIQSCPRYSGITLTDVKVGPSPDWLQQRLASIGVSSINNVVDITNYVLHECGQPLHAFDADKIQGKKVIVRRAGPEEKFTTLDGIERTLSTDDLLIADAKEGMCIAGVFGGLNSGINDQTHSVFLESACFNPASVRKSSKNHGLKTDASFRFERGTDPEMTVYALRRAVALLCEITGAKVSSGSIDIYPVPMQPVVLDLGFSYLDKFCGDVLPAEKVIRIISSLGMKVLAESAESIRLEIPLFKVDVTRPVDVVEEILRIYGYNNIPIPAKLSSSLPAVQSFDADQVMNKVGDYLAGNGFFEIVCNSLTKFQHTEEENNSAVRLLNPLSQDLEQMRKDLLQSGLETIEYNRNRRQADLRLFEFGKTYKRVGAAIQENHRLALFLTGRKFDINWTGDKSPVDFFFLKAFAENLLRIVKADPGRLKTESYHNEDFAQALQYRQGDHVLMTIGNLRRSRLKQFNITNEVFYADVNWDRLLKFIQKSPVQYKEVSKFPAVRRDLSMLIQTQISYAQIQEIAFRTEKKLLKEMNLFDVYQGNKLEPGKKSYAVAFILEDDTQTLTDKQIDKTMDRLMAAFEKDAGAVIRKN